jgi:methionyl-tRNA synthetase
MSVIITRAMTDLDLRMSVGACVDLARLANRFWEEEQPWKKTQKMTELDSVIYCALECVRVIMTALQPVIPRAADAVLSGLGVSKDLRKAEHLKLFSVEMAGNNLSALDSFILLPKENKKKTTSEKH